MSGYKIYKKAMANDTDPNLLDYDGEKWYQAWTDADDEVELWILLGNSDLLVEKSDTGERRRLRIS